MFGSMFDEPASSVDSVIRENQIENKSSFQQSAGYSGSGGLFVVSVSGRAFVSESLDSEFVRNFAQKVSSMHSQGLRFVIVVGQGGVAEDYAAAAQGFNASKTAVSEIGVQFSKANALLLASALDAAHPKIISEFSEAVSVLDSGRIPIMVSHFAGVSSEATAALCAEFLGGSAVFLADFRGIEKLSPKGKKARLVKKASFDSFLDFALDSSKAGESELADVFAAQVLKRSKIPAMVLNFQDLNNFESAIQGGEFEGTRVQ